MDDKHLVFVYGTLRRGGVRSMPELFPGARFVGQGTVGGSLYDLGPHPGMQADGSGALVVGEVYEVDGETLGRLDEVEAGSHYRRRRVEATLGGGGGRAECWVYEPDARLNSRRVLIPSGDWIEYARTKTEWPEEVWTDEAER